MGAEQSRVKNQRSISGSLKTQEAKKVPGMASLSQEGLTKPNGESSKPIEEEPKKVLLKEEEVPEQSKTKEDGFTKPDGVTKKAMEEPKKAPHMYEAIMKEADLHSGVFLNNKRKRNWVDKETGCNCFMLFARDLSITWSEEPVYWQWLPIQKIRCYSKNTEISDPEIEVAELLNVCWLEVHGKFRASLLTPKTCYEVVFVVMMKGAGLPSENYGWESPVNLRLQFANGAVQEHKEYLQEVPRGQWVELKVGQIVRNGDEDYEVEVSLFDYSPHWKHGLVIKGVMIRPKK